MGEDHEGRGTMADDTSKSDRMFRLRFHLFSTVKREVAGHQGTLSMVSVGSVVVLVSLLFDQGRAPTESAGSGEQCFLIS